MAQVHVVKSDPPETKEILAEAIVRVGTAVNFLNSNGLNRKAVVLLLHDATKVPKKEIIAILDALPRLKGWYCR